MTSAPPALPAGFVELPHEVYAGEPRWIPESPAAVRRAFSAENPWFAQGVARAWCVPGVARAAAFRDPACRVEGRPAAFFGFWETRGGRRDNAEIFAEIEGWAMQQGAEELYGPVNFTTYGTYRLRTGPGDEEMPFPGEPYNRSSYPSLLESLGFRPHRRYLTQIIETAGAQPIIERFRPFHRTVTARGYRFARLDLRLWMDNLRIFHSLVDRTFAKSFAYTPLSIAAFAFAAGRSLLAKACPETSIVIYAPDGTLAGFLLAVPHYGPLVVAGAGAGRVEAGELSYHRHLPLLARRGNPPFVPLRGNPPFVPLRGNPPFVPLRGKPAVLVKTIGVAPDHRRQKLMPALAAEAFLRAGNRWSRWWNVLMREENPSRRPGEDVASSRRWYTLYRKVLPPA
ncbi:MAG: hypothetical protein GY856_49565 [bacterium]|nr:hypothetical protein [bacterium]